MAPDVLICNAGLCLQTLLPYTRKHLAGCWKLRNRRDESCPSLYRSFPPSLHYCPRSAGWSHATKCFLQELNVEWKCLVMDKRLVEEKHLVNQNCTWTVLASATEILMKEAAPKVDDQDMVLEGLLPSLQALASTPAYPEGLCALYASFFVGNLAEQVWHFAWPVAVALLHKSLLPVAVVSFVSKLVTFVGGPWVGVLMDSLPRVLAFNALSIVQPWFLVLVAAGAVERLTGLASGVAFERDWVILLAGADRPIALAHANAVLCRVDLICEIVGTSFFGLLLAKFHPATCFTLAAVTLLCSLPILIFLVHCTNKLSKGVLDRTECHVSWEAGAQSAEVAGKGALHNILLGWSQYLAHPVLPASLAAVFLYFNIGLAPGSLMTSFLIQKGLNPSIIGAFSGMGAFMGFAATFISAGLIQKFGVLKAGAIGLVSQASLLAVAVSVYWSNSLTHLSSLIFFLALIALSRLGHFTYDIVGGQILQTAVSPSLANVIGTTEISLASLAELIMLGISIVANDVSHFGGLAGLSMAAVFGAAGLYHCWMLRFIEEQQKQFPMNSVADNPDSAWQIEFQELISAPMSL
eukprot:c28703_g1_i4 orf=415-2154(-)